MEAWEDFSFMEIFILIVFIVEGFGQYTNFKAQISLSLECEILYTISKYYYY